MDLDTPRQREIDLIYLRNYPEARQVYAAVCKLVSEGRTGNHSQIAAYTGVSRTRVATVTRMLRQRGWIVNVSKGAAYHWRPTSKPMPRVPDGEPGPERLARMFPLGTTVPAGEPGPADVPACPACGSAEPDCEPGCSAVPPRLAGT